MSAGWGSTLGLTSFVTSMAVNALVTGLIVFKILKVFLEVNPILVELTLDSTGGTKLRHVIFVIIESGMALFAIQLIRLVFWFLPMEWTIDAYSYIIAINEMFNVIFIFYYYFFCFIDNIYQGIAPTIILVRVSMRLSFDDPESFKEAVGSLRFNNPPSDSNTSTGSVPPQLGSQGQEISELEDT